MTEMFGEAWSIMSVPDLAPDDDDDLTFDAISSCMTTIMAILKNNEVSPNSQNASIKAQCSDVKVLLKIKGHSS